MPAPTSYSEDDLAAYMLQELGDVGQDLALSATANATGDLGDFTEPVNDVLLDFGTDDITTISGSADIRGLRALAAVHAWRLARKRAAARYDQADGTQSLKRSQVFGMIDKNLSLAEDIAAALGYGSPASQLVIKVGHIHYVQDPYLPIDESPAGLPSSSVIIP